MKCIFCGKESGFFKREHPQCRKAAEIGEQHICKCIDYVYANRNCMDIKDIIADTVRQCHIPQTAIKPLLLECWRAKVIEAFRDGVIDDEEIKILRELLLPMGITSQEIQNSPQGKMLLEYGQRLFQQTMNSAIKNRDFSSLAADVQRIAHAYDISDDVVKNMVLKCWNSILDNAFDDGVLDEEEERLMNQLGDQFALSASDIAPYKERIVKGAILRDILSGIVPHRLTITNQLPVMLQNKKPLFGCLMT